MSNLNKVQIIGRLGKDPEVRYMPNGKAVASIAVAVSEKWKDKTGSPQESTEWFNVTAFDRLAEICGEYLIKGALVYIEGKQKTDKYTDNNGVEKYSTKLIADKMQMLGAKSENSNQQQQNRPQQQPQPQSRQQQPQNRNQPQQNASEPNFDFDDSIPF